MSTGGVDPPVVDAPRVRRWGVAASSMVALAAVSVLLRWWGLLLVLGSTVVPMWVAGLVLLCAGTVIRVALEWSEERDQERPGRRRGSRVVTATAWLLVVLSTTLGVFLEPSYVVVEPAGSGGCRAVVSESAFMFVGSGSVHVAGGWGPFALPVGDYRTDDAFQPMSTGAYEATWDEQFGGLLSVDGVLPGNGSASGGTFEFDC